MKNLICKCKNSEEAISEPYLDDFGTLITSHSPYISNKSMTFVFQNTRGENHAFAIELSKAEVLLKASEILCANYSPPIRTPEEFVEALLTYDCENSGYGRFLGAGIFTFASLTLASVLGVISSFSALSKLGNSPNILRITCFVIAAILALWVIATVSFFFFYTRSPQKYEFPSKVAKAVIELRRKNEDPKLRALVKDS